jgi:hypothetical protein
MERDFSLCIGIAGHTERISSAHPRRFTLTVRSMSELHLDTNFILNC